MTAKLLTGLEKAAVLLKSLPPATSEKVLKQMEPRQANLLTAEFARLAKRPDLKETMARVLDEAVSLLGDGNQKGPDNQGTPSGEKKDGGEKPGGKTAPGSPASKEGSQVNVRLESSPTTFNIVAEDDGDPLTGLAALSPDLLKTALEGESPRTISLLINSMNVEVAGEVYKRLSAAKRKEVTLRFADASPVNDTLLRHIARAVLNKCQALRSANSSGNEQGEREKRLAGMVRSLERAERLETLTALEEADAALAGRIKALLYLFEDLLRMENSSIQKLLMEVDMKLLAAALFGAPPEIQERLQANLSRRAKDLLKEEIDLTGKVSSGEVKKARLTLEEAMQRLDQRGELLMME